MAIHTEVVPLEENRVRIDVVVPKDEVDKRVERTLRKLAREIRVPGFRPGKAPTKVVAQRFGTEVVFEEMLRDALGEWYGAAVESSGVRPIDDPEIDLDDEMGDDGLKFNATVHTRPKAKLGDYKGLEVAKGNPEVPEGAIDEEIDRLRGLAATLAPVERGAEVGDFVTIDFDGSIDGQDVAGATARDYLVEVGGPRLVAAFSDRLVGLAAGGTTTFPIDYPEADGRSELAGKTVEYTVTMKQVQQKVLPELTDELAQEISEYDTAAEVRAAIAERLDKSAQDEVDELFRRMVIDAAVAKATVDIPEVMTRNRVDAILHETSHRLPQGMTMEQYLQLSGRTLDEARADLAPDAEMAIRRELVVEAVAETEQVAVSDEEVENQVRIDAEAAGRDADELLRELNKYGGFETLRDDMVMRKTVDLLIEHSTAIPVALKEARDQLWTPDKAKEAAGEAGGLWTPDSPAPKKRATKKTAAKEDAS